MVPGDHPRQIENSTHLSRLESYGELVLYSDKPCSIDQQLDRVRHADVIMNTRGSVRWPRSALQQLPNLRLIATCSVGTDMIDLTAATELGVTVSNQPGKIAPYVAEHIIGLMFSVAKRAAFQTAELKAGRWTLKENIYLKGKKLGLIGTGNIGQEVALLAKAMGMKLTAWTFNPSPKRAAALGVQFVELDDLLRSSDVVSIHVRLSDDSRHMIGRRELGLMRPGALFINGGRGELVNSNALVDALNSGHLGGAGLDVFDQEPLPSDHPILSCDQVVLTPHIADQTPEGIESLNEGIVNNVIAFLEGHPQNVVTKAW